ncbi:MAG: chemotaxis signal relay system protein-glutamate methylesterase CheB [Rhodobacteraceae bacterium HLUCCA12]|nr:MAG: chemotaxis signal relay system protein-glutamate methylesterase CheB [Rhodobacteraceae bacterium HLUCCA12]
MTRPCVLLADDRPLRLRRLAAQIAADGACDLLAAVRNLSDAYTLTERHQPDVVLVCSEMAAGAEFLMFVALLDLLDLRCVVFGGPGVMPGGDGRIDVVTLDDGHDAATLIARIAVGEHRRGAGPAPHPFYSRCVVIGASTGGIEALSSVLSTYPPDCPPTLIVQHIRREFVSGVVQRLDRQCLAHVGEARQGAPLRQGHVYLAPDDTHHLVVRDTGGLHCALVAGEPVSGHRPSVDVLFRSAAALGDSVVGVLLTGMGRDGAEGLLRIRRNGGRTIIQDRPSSTVYGMPRAAAELGAAMQELPLHRIGTAILNASRTSSAMVG